MQWTRLVVASILLLFLGACDDAMSPGAPSGPTDTGSVSVFLTDAPSDDFDQVLVTIEKLQLIGDGSPATIFSGKETIDLKDLENFSDLFVYAEHVPTGYFSKIRLLVSRIQLIRGEETVDAEIPANGKLDLVPGGVFGVYKDVTLVIELDIDAKRSIQAVGTGSGKYMFRPVVFVDIKETRPPQKLARVHGVITHIFDDESFELCSTIFMASHYITQSSSHTDGGLGDRHRCMTVELDGDTGLFDSNGDPTDVGDLMVDDETTVVGRFHLVDANHDLAEIQPLGGKSGKKHKKHKKHRGGGWGDSDKDSHKDSDSGSDSDTDGGGGPKPPDAQIVLLAYVIEMGPAGTFLNLAGVIESDLDAMNEFDFMIAPDQGFGDGSVVSALLQDGTRLFNRRGQELDDDEIMADTDAKIDGVFSADSSSLLYKTALLILDIEPEIVDELRGRIVSIENAIRRLTLGIEDDGMLDEECVDVPEDADIFLLVEEDGRLTSTRGEFEDLSEGQRVDVYGEFPYGSGCFVADTVIAFEVDAKLCGGVNGLCDDGDVCLIEEGRCDEFAEGVCVDEPEMCPDVFAPVCGCDGNNYDNACEALKKGVTVESEDACEIAEPVECADNDGCEVDQFCDKAEGSCELVGECEDVPQVCQPIDAPVCGCNGVTYDNECVANRAGTSVAEQGSCDIDPELICDEELCLNDAERRNECIRVLTDCLENEPELNDEECVVAALLVCRE